MGWSARDPGMIGVAAIGAGRMGRTHLATLGALPGIRVLSVTDRDPAAAEAGRRLARAERAHTDPAVAVAEAGVDAVVIVTPTGTHAELIELAARAGRAVWCEKPIASGLAETRRVLATVGAAGVPVQIGFMRRYDPGYRAAKARIDAGELGRIETFRAVSRDAVCPPPAYLATSGGIFLDLGVHDLDLARFLVGEVAEVSAWGAVLFDPAVGAVGDVDTGIAMLRFRDGALGTLELGRHTDWGYDIRTEIVGARAKVVVEAERRTPIAVSRGMGTATDHHPSFPERFGEAFRDQLAAFFAALAAGETPGPGPEDSLETLRLALAVTRSHAEGRPVRVEEIDG